MHPVNALLHHIWVFRIVKVGDAKYLVKHRACRKGRLGHNCHGRNGYRECS